MGEYSVVIVGGAPTGLMLAAELTLAGADVAIVERRTDQHVEGRVRVVFMHARLRAGSAWCGVNFTQSDAGVTVEISNSTSLRTKYLVGCDGGRSVARKIAGIDFPGLEASTSWMMAEVEMDEQPELGFRTDEAGTHAIGPTSQSGLYGVLVMEPYAAQPDQPSMAELRAAMRSVFGTDFGMRRASWISRFTDASRQAASYRNGRVLLAGDAAHIHPPQGGQGLGTGVQDAVNLGWKLAQVVADISPASLLDTYHDERHPVGARVLHNTMAQVALGRPDERSQAARDTVQDLLSADEPRRRIVGDRDAARA